MRTHTTWLKRLGNASCGLRKHITIAGYEALAHVLPVTTNNFVYSSLLWSRTKSNSRLFVVVYPSSGTEIRAMNTVYCVYFIIFLCATVKLFSDRFLPLHAPNPGNATAEACC